MVEVGEFTWTDEMPFPDHFSNFNLPCSKLFGIDESMDVDTENPEQDDHRRRLVERWRLLVLQETA
jgi:hypothetical protein